MSRSNDIISLTTAQRWQLRYGAIWGLGTFAGGILYTLAVLPESLRTADIASWKIASWVWLNAHGVGIAGQQVGGLGMLFQDVSFLRENPSISLLSSVPPLFALLTVLLVVISMGGVQRDRHILENAVAGVGGYLLAGLITVIVSGAQPGVGLIIGLVVVLGGAMYVGAAVASRLPIPVFAVTSLSGLLGIGLFLFIAAGVVSTVVLPLGRAALLGGVFGIAAVWVAVNIG